MEDNTKKRTIAAWEEQTSKMLRTEDIDAKEEVTLAEFEKRAEEIGFLGVDQEARTKFLSENSYDLSRANYLNGQLESKPEESKTE